MTAEQIVEFLNLKPHPEGGHFGETFRDDPHPTLSRMRGRVGLGAARRIDCDLFPAGAQ